MATTSQKRERATIPVQRYTGLSPRSMEDMVAVEEPLEIQLVFGKGNRRQAKPVSVTMRTPGNDAELALGFLLSEGIIHDVEDVECVTSADDHLRSGPDGPPCRYWPLENAVKVELSPEIELNLATLERNFYTTSSCGVCGKASLLALRAACPPRVAQNFHVDTGMLYELHSRLRTAQEVFQQTGGIHSAALFNTKGELMRIREDVGRHNALDKLIGTSLLEDELPLRERLLLLSGRASFELMQKTIMAGIGMVAAFGAPSSLAVALAKEFDITLIGFLKNDHFNVYHGAWRLRTGHAGADARLSPGPNAERPH
jgi:FdhD protein